MNKALITYAAIVIAAIVGLGGYEYVGWADLDPSDWAAWVQAIGSISAIVGAYYFGERQAKAALENSLQMHKIQRAQKRESIKAIAKAALDATHEVTDFYGNDRPNKLSVLLIYEQRVFSGIIDALAAIPIHEVGSAAAVTGLLGLKNSMIEMQTVIDKYLATPIPPHRVLYGSHDEQGSEDVLHLKGRKGRIEYHYKALIIALETE